MRVFDDLEGKVAVVTGGARGLGLHMARALAGRGVEVALLDVLPLVEESATTLAADFPVGAVGLRADVTDATDVDAAFARATDALGTPTVLVNAAATAVAVLANDSDIDGGPKSIVSASDPTNGTVVITGGGTGLTYQPDAGYCNDGSPFDTFTYTLNGGSTAMVSMTVNCT